MNTLTDKTLPHGEIRFIHSDGKEHRFYTAVNEMTGDRLSAFDNSAPTLNESLSSIRATFSRIRATAQKVISYEGTKHFRA